MTHPYLTDWRESRLPEWRETDMADRITLEAPELRPVGQVPCVPTSTGLLIGCAYRRPMPQPSADAERIQSAAHPRACGEHATAGAHAAKDNGSSPRLRGTRPGEQTR